MGPFFAVLLGRYVVQNTEQYIDEVQPKFVRALKTPDFYSRSKEKSEGICRVFGK